MAMTPLREMWSLCTVIEMNLACLNYLLIYFKHVSDHFKLVEIKTFFQICFRLDLLASYYGIWLRICFDKVKTCRQKGFTSIIHIQF